ncbi:MAG: TetR/AcrR family transcriptional regulator [Planctomycetota bacterium]|nr:MAG: TetR/AcrR family transcriptional regulator [Planctomycetota bacterium]
MTEPALQRREEILAKAEELFAERGYHATSVRDIADALDIQAGSLYAHIETKEDLLWELVNAAADRFFAAVDPILESDLIPLEKLRRVIAAHVAVVCGNVTSASVYSTQWRHLSEPRRGEFAARRHEYEQKVRDLVRTCIRSGALADVDEKFAALLILSSINWIYQWYKPDGPMSPEEIARKLTDMLLSGLKRVT